ncbi:MAG: hypothetical protein D6717_03890 [Gammaproteobacteria bacterium]|nr:MAG: hypothetical protein D6717_03890 [Gammaproteobacteria bacterium]
MEFYAETDAAGRDAAWLQQHLSLDNIPHYCAFVSEVRPRVEGGMEMASFWGVNEVRSEPIAGGVRFTLPDCPNVMSWTVTTGLDPEPDRIVIHATINRREHDPDFIESLQSFVDDWAAGLAGHEG